MPHTPWDTFLHGWKIVICILCSLRSSSFCALVFEGRPWQYQSLAREMKSRWHLVIATSFSMMVTLFFQCRFAGTKADDSLYNELSASSRLSSDAHNLRLRLVVSLSLLLITVCVSLDRLKERDTQRWPMIIYASIVSPVGRSVYFQSLFSDKLWILFYVAMKRCIAIIDHLINQLDDRCKLVYVHWLVIDMIFIRMRRVTTTSKESNEREEKYAFYQSPSTGLKRTNEVCQWSTWGTLPSSMESCDDSICWTKKCW